MKAQDIQKHIDRVVGTEGTLRIPSWWMYKILNDMVKYLDEKPDVSELQALKKDIAEIKAALVKAGITL